MWTWIFICASSSFITGALCWKLGIIEGWERHIEATEDDNEEWHSLADCYRKVELQNLDDAKYFIW